MPQNAWNPKRERQYEHIKESLEERGAKEDKAEEIAARPLIDGTSAMGWVRSQLALNTGTLTCGNCDGRGGRDDEGVAVGVRWALAAGRDATAGGRVAVRVVAATGWMSLCACRKPSAISALYRF